MKTAVEQLSFYAAYHRNPWNRATHYFGIPSIVFAILVPMAWIGVDVGGFRMTLALLFVVSVLCYYYILDAGLATGMFLMILPLLYAALWTASFSWGAGLSVFAGFFVGGWILQFIGHVVFEKRRPAFTDNVIQLLIGPLFFLLEILHFLGFKRRLYAEIASSGPPQVAQLDR